MVSNRRYRAALVALPCSYCPDGNQARLDGSSCTDRANTGRAVEGSTDKRGTDRANTGRAVELTKIMLAVIEHTRRTNQPFVRSRGNRCQTKALDEIQRLKTSKIIRNR
jgi:hypothetical protein